jgi:acetyl-CoA carboxylase biotin carboxylase subunit
VIEEAQAELKKDETKSIINDAIKFAKGINYTNVGTIEFLYANGRHYLMEMNARIQVEHPVTEETFNIDIVKLQLKIANGEKIDLSSKKSYGHAIEFRINAEDPFNNFKPSSGTIEFLHLPLGRNVRIDTHIYQGYKVPAMFDSLLVKLIAKGETREEAISVARRAFEEIRIEGIKTNILLIKRLLNNENFLKNNLYTTFLEEFINLENQDKNMN